MKTYKAPKYCQYPCCMEKLIGSGNRKYCPMHSRVIEYNNRQNRLIKAREEKAKKQETI